MPLDCIICKDRDCTVRLQRIASFPVNFTFERLQFSPLLCAYSTVAAVVLACTGDMPFLVESPTIFD